MSCGQVFHDIPKTAIFVFLLVWIATILGIIFDGVAFFVPLWVQRPGDPDYLFGLIGSDNHNLQWARLALWFMLTSVIVGVLLPFVLLFLVCFTPRRHYDSIFKHYYLITAIFSLINAILIFIVFTAFAIKVPLMKSYDHNGILTNGGFVLGFSAWCALIAAIIYLLTSIFSFTIGRRYGVSRDH